MAMRDELKPFRVLELGAGCGVLGQGLAASCGCDVVLTESGCALEGDDGGTSLSWLQMNINLNSEAFEQSGGRCRAAKLAWGDPEDIANVRALEPEGFDLIVASDVLYDSQRYPELWSTFEAFAPANSPSLDGLGDEIEWTVETAAASAVAIFGYQIRNGAERRFGNDSEEFELVRDKLPQPPRDSDGSAGRRNPTGKSVAYVVRKGAAASTQPG